MSASWAPYPPCQSGTCSDQGCCAEGMSLSFSLYPSLLIIFVAIGISLFLSPSLTLSLNNIWEKFWVHAGYKFRWPALVGKSEQVATAVIERDNPLVTVVPLPDGVVGYTDFCCNRVYIFLDSDGNVRSTPVVGWNVTFVVVLK